MKYNRTIVPIMIGSIILTIGSGFLSYGRESTKATNIDYSPYSAVLQAYELEYEGMQIKPQQDRGSLYDIGGFCYSHLIDLNHDGILELVLVGSPIIFEFDPMQPPYSERIPGYPDIVKIYSLTEDGKLQFVDGIPMTDYNTHVSSHFAVEYVVAEDRTYILVETPSQHGQEEARYYSYDRGFSYLDKYYHAYLESSTNTMKYEIEGTEHTEEEYRESRESIGTSEVHLITNLNAGLVESLQMINRETKQFLDKHPVKNFEGEAGVYRDGHFYFLEYLPSIPPEITVKRYYHALTKGDYQAMKEIYWDESMVDAIKAGRENSLHAPGNIVSDMEGFSEQRIENMEADTAEMIRAVMETIEAHKNVYIVKCLVNEVLNPSVVSLGMQEGGGTYKTWFIVSSDDQDSHNWKIEAVLDDRFTR